jgi:hypothetical protein
MKIRRLALVLALAGSWHSSAPAGAGVRDEYAFSAIIDIWPGSPLQWLELPLPVYRDALDPDLHDLRVLNGKGEVVPYVLQRPLAAVARAPATQTLPIYAMRGDPGEASAALSLKLNIYGDSTSLEVTRGDEFRPDAPLVAFLIDARAVADPIEALTFAMPEAGDFSVTALLESSDDYGNWRTVSSHLALARLSHDGETFENLGIAVPPMRARFWRLSARPGETLPKFDSVSVTPVAGSEAVERRLIQVAGRPIAGATGEYEFDLEAQVPVDRLQLELPDVNTVARVQFFARRAPGEAWRPVARAAVYRLQPGGRPVEGDDLRSAPVAIDAESSRYWRVVVDPRGGGLGAGVPGLRAGWLAHRVLFVARGATPFELVYGNHDAEDAEVGLAELLPGGTVSAEGTLAQPFALVRSPRFAGGLERLAAPPPPGNWRLGILWAALCAGVLSLAALAWRLARQMRATEDQSGRE